MGFLQAPWLMWLGRGHPFYRTVSKDMTGPNGCSLQTSCPWGWVEHLVPVGWGAALWSPGRVGYPDVSYYIPLLWIILTELQAPGKTKIMAGFHRVKYMGLLVATLLSGFESNTHIRFLPQWKSGMGNPRRKHFPLPRFFWISLL